MTMLALMTMIGICGFVWGGFALLLALALRSERTADRRDDPDPGRP